VANPLSSTVVRDDRDYTGEEHYKRPCSGAMRLTLIFVCPRTSYLQEVHGNDGTNLVNHRFWRAEAMTAAGQLAQAKLGGSILVQRIYDPLTQRVEALRDTRLSSPAGIFSIQDTEYDFDTLGNVALRRDLNAGTEETFGYDSRNRMTWSALDDGVATTTKSYAYDTLGNVLSKTGVGAYLYGAGNDPSSCASVATPRPHAVSHVDDGSMLGVDYCYDANGNMLQGYNFSAGAVRTFTWTPFNKPRRINQSGAYLEFHYDADRNRYRQVNDFTGEQTLYINAGLEKVTIGATETLRHYVSAGGAPVAVYTTHQAGGASPTTRYFHRDHLGSVVAMSDDSGTVVESFSYDPHGKRRNPTTWTDAIDHFDLLSFMSSLTPKSFTGHEYLDDVGLIHMGGRVYDPDLGRFISADPFVQEVGDPQNLNRYTYVLNNPLSYTDPSGYFFGKLFKAIGSILSGIFKGIGAAVKAVGDQIQTLAAIGVAAVVGPVCAPCAGFLAGMISSGGDLKAGIVGALTGAALGGVPGTPFEGVHGIKQGIAGLGKGVTKVLAHGIVGGVSQALMGGEFVAGFLAGGFTQAASLAGLFETFDLPGQGASLTAGDYLGNAAVAAVVGGTASVLGGGKFRNGALTGAFSRFFNDLKAERFAKGEYRKFLDKLIDSTEHEIAYLESLQIADRFQAFDVDARLYQLHNLRAALGNSAFGDHLSSVVNDGVLLAADIAASRIPSKVTNLPSFLDLFGNTSSGSIRAYQVTAWVSCPSTECGINTIYRGNRNFIGCDSMGNACSGGYLK